MFDKLFFSVASFRNKNNQEQDSKTNKVSHFALLALMKKIESTYNNTQMILDKKALNTLDQSDVIKWHIQFIADNKAKFATIDNVNLRCLIINSMYNDTVKNWIHVFHGVKPSTDETLVQYSLRAANESCIYNEKLDEFIKANAIKEITLLIETSIGKEEFSKSNNDGANYVNEIYQQCLQVNTLNNPTQIFNKIHLILIDFIKNYLKSNYQTIEESIYDENQEQIINLIN